jgi:hypothetical protein
VVIAYHHFGINYQSHPLGSRIQKIACSPNTDFIWGRVWEVKSHSSVVSASRVDASGWMEGSVVVSAAGQKHSVIKGILTNVIVRHRRTLTWAKWEKGKKIFD